VFAPSWECRGGGNTPPPPVRMLTQLLACFAQEEAYGTTEKWSRHSLLVRTSQ
jgi:hypothetical protein